MSTTELISLSKDFQSSFLIKSMAFPFSSAFLTKVFSSGSKLVYVEAIHLEDYVNRLILSSDLEGSNMSNPYSLLPW